ncbi:MAG: DUF6273 domain-containing protein, partial [Lachnospiraceae bacterium]
AVAMLDTGTAGCAGCNREAGFTPTVVPAGTQKPEEITKTPITDPAPTDIPEIIPTAALTVTEAPVATPTMTVVTATPKPTVTTAPTTAPAATTEPTATTTPVPTNTPTPTAVPTNTPTPMPTSTPKPTSTPTPTPIKGIVAGDYVTFGSYEQDNDLDNGKEPIEWLVLEVKDGKAFLLAKYGLDVKAYDSNFDRDIHLTGFLSTWETCTLRAWLNDEFYNTAFTAKEQESIELTTVKNTDNATYDTDAGNDTKDKVYLLSMDESIKYLGKAVNRKNLKAVTTPTKYTMAQGLVMKEPNQWYGDNCNWWLRTPGQSTYRAVYIADDGILMDNGGYADTSKYNAVRPVVWIDVATADVEKVN